MVNLAVAEPTGSIALDIPLDGNGWARGRNGGFTPRNIHVDCYRPAGSEPGQHIGVLVEAKNSWGTSPIIFHLNAAEARTLANSLLEAARVSERD